MTIASIVDLYLLDAFATVSLSMDTTISLILRTRYSVLLWGFKLTLNSETPNVIQSKWLQSGELGGQVSFSHTSVRLSVCQSCDLLLLWARAQSCWEMKCQFPAIWLILRHHLSQSCSEMFISCPGTSWTCWGLWWWAPPGWWPGQSPCYLFFLLLIKVSEDPPEVINQSNFLLL